MKNRYRGNFEGQERKMKLVAVNSILVVVVGGVMDATQIRRECALL